MKKIIKIFAYLVTLAWAVPVLAQTKLEDLQSRAQSLNPMNFNAPTDLAARMINLLMAFIGSISLALFVYAGILWMTAAGNAERTTKAKSIMFWTAAGLIIMMSSYALVTVVFNFF